MSDSIALLPTLVVHLNAAPRHGYGLVHTRSAAMKHTQHRHTAAAHLDALKGLSYMPSVALASPRRRRPTSGR